MTRKETTQWPFATILLLSISLGLAYGGLEHEESDHTSRANLKPIIVDEEISVENLKKSARFGLPSGDNLRLFNDFIISYDRRVKSPVWAMEHLTPWKLSQNNARRSDSFSQDTSIHEYFRAKDSDYHSSGYDRGHMAAAGNHKVRQQDNDQTFTLSNMCPQKANLNRGLWERLEGYTRWLGERSANLYVVTGPLYLPTKAKDGNLYLATRVLGDRHIPVPTHFFKVILAESNEGTLSLEAFLMPNDDSIDKKDSIDDYRVEINQLDMIERPSGIIFFDKVSRSKVETPSTLPSNYTHGH